MVYRMSVNEFPRETSSLTRCGGGFVTGSLATEAHSGDYFCKGARGSRRDESTEILTVTAWYRRRHDEPAFLPAKSVSSGSSGFSSKITLGKVTFKKYCR